MFCESGKILQSDSVPINKDLKINEFKYDMNLYSDSTFSKQFMRYPDIRGDCK